MTDDDLLQRIKDSMDAEDFFDALSRAYTLEELVDEIADVILEAREEFHYLTYGEY